MRTSSREPPAAPLLEPKLQVRSQVDPLRPPHVPERERARARVRVSERERERERARESAREREGARESERARERASERESASGRSGVRTGGAGIWPNATHNLDTQPIDTSEPKREESNLLKKRKLPLVATHQVFAGIVEIELRCFKQTPSLPQVMHLRRRAQRQYVYFVRVKQVKGVVAPCRRSRHSILPAETGVHESNMSVFVLLCQ